MLPGPRPCGFARWYLANRGATDTTGITLDPELEAIGTDAAHGRVVFGDDTGVTWACPNTGIIQNPTPELLLHGAASVAIVKPYKRPMFDLLTRVWKCVSRVQKGQDSVHLGITPEDVAIRVSLSCHLPYSFFLSHALAA